MNHPRTISIVASAAAAIAGLALLTGCSPASSSAGAATDCTPAHGSVQTITPGTLTVSVFLTPPYTAQTDGDLLSGVDGKIVRRIAEMECLKVDASEVAATAAFTNIDTKRTDITLAGIYQSEERERKYGITIPMYGDKMGIISKTGTTDIEALEGDRIGTLQGSIANQWLIQAVGTENAIVYQDYASMMNDLKVGRLDGAIATVGEASHQLEINDVTGFEIAAMGKSAQIEGPGEVNNIIVPMHKSNASLLQAFDEDIQTLIDEGFITEVLKEYGLDPALAGGA